MFSKLLILLLGIIIRPFAKYSFITKKRWVFGSHDGANYGDNSKYLFEFINKKHEDIDAIWITRSFKVIKELRNKGYKAFHNFSITGMWITFTAEVVMFCISRNDVLFVWPKKHRKIVNLFHGMPMKKIIYDHPPHHPQNANLKSKIWNKFVVMFKHEDLAMLPVTSEFFKNIFRTAFNNCNIFITGQPRTDVFFEWKKESIKEKLGFKVDEFIVTYMPTHRAYGSGLMNPRIFENNPQAIQYFSENNIKIVWKFHRNMYKRYEPNKSGYGDTFADLTPNNIDPQELIFISDIMITDYSSCYVDFLLLNRPVIFYFYDKYEEDDNQLYFSPQDHNVGEICYSETQLLNSIIKPRLPETDLYHKYKDSNSCQRVMEIIL